MVAYASCHRTSTIPPPGLVLLLHKSAQSISRVERSAKETFSIEAQKPMVGYSDHARFQHSTKNKGRICKNVYNATIEGIKTTFSYDFFSVPNY
jgi:hypothetical protein